MITNRKLYISAFDWHQNQRPWTTLNTRTALYCTNDASFEVHHENLKEDTHTIDGRYVAQGLYFQAV